MSQDQATAMSGSALIELRSPVQVAIIDIGKPLSDVDCTRASEPAYTAAWILVCRSGRPLGNITIPLKGTLITVAELEYALRQQLGEREAGHPQVNTSALAKASVVIPTNFARADQLQRCVERLTKLDHPDYEIIVVDNRPEKAPPIDIIGARIVRELRPGISAARNRGIAAATGDIVAFTDDDVVADHRWLRAIGERFSREPDVVAVTGLVVP